MLVSSSKNILKSNSKNFKFNVISPKLIKSPYLIPGCPPKIKIETLDKYELRTLENKYDKFLEEKCQILMLLGLIDEIFETRDLITLRINKILRDELKARNSFYK